MHLINAALTALFAASGTLAAAAIIHTVRECLPALRQLAREL